MVNPLVMTNFTAVEEEGATLLSNLEPQHSDVKEESNLKE